jgi:hypothetical protein
MQRRCVFRIFKFGLECLSQLDFDHDYNFDSSKHFNGLYFLSDNWTLLLSNIRQAT